jgi:hypothetical protein
MSAKPHLEAQHETIAALVVDGWSAIEIADELGCCKSGVRKYCKRKGLPLVDVKNIFPERRAEFEQLARDAPEATYLAERLGVSVTTIHKWARICGISIENPYHVGCATTHSSYVMIRAVDHPNAASNGCVREHILVMEKHLGRYLEPGECVHHKDRVKHHNDIANLELMTVSEHAALHAKLGETGWAKYHENVR